MRKSREQVAKVDRGQANRRARLGERLVVNRIARREVGEHVRQADHPRLTASVRGVMPLDDGCQRGREAQRPDEHPSGERVVHLELAELEQHPLLGIRPQQQQPRVLVVASKQDELADVVEERCHA